MAYWKKSKRVSVAGQTRLPWAYKKYHHMGRQIDHQRLNRAIKTACRKAGIELLTFHGFRHTFGTRLGQKGFNIRIDWLKTNVGG